MTVTPKDWHKKMWAKCNYGVSKNIQDSLQPTPARGASVNHGILPLTKNVTRTLFCTSLNTGAVLSNPLNHFSPPEWQNDLWECVGGKT